MSTRNKTGPNWFLRLALLVALGLSGWSMYTTLMSYGVPQLFAFVGVAVFDLAALGLAQMVQRNQDTPRRFTLLAMRLVVALLVATSATVNGLHAYQEWGVVAAIIFAAAPVVPEVLFEFQHRMDRPAHESPRPLRWMFDPKGSFGQVKAAVLAGTPAVLPQVQVVREPEPAGTPRPNCSECGQNRPEPRLTGHENPAVPVPEPRPELARTAPEPAVLAPEPPSSRPERVDELAELIKTRGGDKNAVTLEEVMGRYGVAKTTASALRKDAVSLLGGYA